MIGISDSNSASKPYSLNTEVLEKCNHSTVAHLFNYSLSTLWLNDIFHEKVFLFLENTSAIEDVILKLKVDTISVENSQHLIENTSLRDNLVYLSSNTAFLANSITKLESQNVFLVESLSIINDT